MLQRALQNVKHRSKATLRSWSYQCESIIAQRSRRIQQLFTFYQHVYSPTELQQIWRCYHAQLHPPLRRFMLSAVGVVGLSLSNGNVSSGISSNGFDWTRERLSLRNFDVCNHDIEFIETLPRNELCDQCKALHMKYCYCTQGNRKCNATNSSETSISNCRRAIVLETELEGKKVIEAAENSRWEPYFSRNEFSIWRRQERSSMYAYKVYARFDDITAVDLLHVQTDLDYRRQWDETAVRLELVDEDPTPGSNSHLIYWEMRWPTMFSNRDYVYCRRHVTDERRKLMLVCSRGAEHSKYPRVSNKVRVSDYWSLMVIKPFRNFHEPGVHYILTYYDDPGVPIPQSIKSWVTQKQMPEFLRKMYAATKQYSCKDAHRMKQIHQLKQLSITNNEYTANVNRSNWLRRMWRQQRDSGK